MKYTAITVGPIIKTLGLAHKTRELWAASYFFSMLMEKIIEKLNQNDKIILPYPDKKKLITDLKIDTDKIKSAGIFPDRLILESENGLFNELQTAVNNAIKELKTAFGFSCNETQLANYITAHIIEFEYNKRSDKKDDNIIYQANDYLANCELQANYKAKDYECFIKMFDKIANTSFYKNKYGSAGFPSILEIATKGLNIEKVDLDDDNIEDNTIWQDLKESNNNKLKTNKKYITIVQADGDNIGAIIKQVAHKGTNEIIKFSQALSSFSLLAAQKISEYKGVPVYTGGDDLLFFAPVTTDKSNIFKLIEEIDSIFNAQVKNKFSNLEKNPSMSYGVSITYYKYPMHEALNTARNLLFKTAKKDPKNHLAIKVQKHSGQVFEALLRKPLKDEFLKLLNRDEGLVINSILHNFEEHKVLLQQTLSPESKANINEFFENFYNEDIHKKSKPFIDEVKKLLLANNSKYNNSNTDKELDKVLELTKAQLQIVKFLNSEKDD